MLPSKEQERKALEQIKKILKGLGDNPDNSYICRAFDGCVHDAESNIENDFADSYKSRYEYREAECERLEERLRQADAKAKETQDKFEKAVEEAMQFGEFNRNAAEAYKAEAEKQNKAATEYFNDLTEAKAKVEAQELEIIKLKAKLYDMMVGA
jgi:hypothetical protein